MRFVVYEEAYKSIYTTASRWIKVNYTLVTNRNYEVTNRVVKTEKGDYTPTFKHNNKVYYLNDFLRLGYPVNHVNEKTGKIDVTIGVYEYDNYYNPLLIEIDEGGEYVRLWNCKTEGI